MLMYAVIMVDKSGEWIESCDSYWCESGLWTDGNPYYNLSATSFVETTFFQELTTLMFSLHQ